MENNVKEKIINTTINLIKESNGFSNNITIRKIAEDANVSVGLINYHFKSKEKLIEICVERIIKDVMYAFSSENDEPINTFTLGVFKFLLENPEISKISILSDLSQPNIKNNSSISFRAISRALSKDNKNKIKAFIFLATIQAAFLNKEITKELLNLDLNNNKDYEIFFNSVTEILNIN
ncbi:MAG: TetR/AcrR family transcriptional regulator [Acholeplasmataceae bacterium]|jgi:AcrR family transcriptional regulator|nr:TetR/AcrR family transcriptional regulator [Acholeplasmataceae bacterium]